MALQAPAKIRATLAERHLTCADLSRETGIKYKALLAEVKHERRPLGLENAIIIADYLGIPVPELVAA